MTIRVSWTIGIRRFDLYSIHYREQYGGDERDEDFGGHLISSRCVFHRSALSFAFVNRKPVVKGHVLVAPIRKVKRLIELTDTETTDLFCLAKLVQSMLENVHKVSSSTVTVQDGPLAGQTVQHVHVHILPRREGDFDENNDVYKTLQTHDKDDSGWRTEEDMAMEAEEYRRYLSSA